MDKNRKKKELQSRREFFKKAAKVALPIVGVAIMASLPFATVDASNTNCGGMCSNNCSGSCSNSCVQYCTQGCRTSCQSTCRGGCTSSNRY